jgi:four helix bundle protein
MQRSAVSIPSNISEGYSRGTRKDYLHFLHIARGSAAELETQVILSGALFPDTKNASLLSEIESMRKMLSALIKGLEAK